MTDIDAHDAEPFQESHMAATRLDGRVDAARHHLERLERMALRRDQDPLVTEALDSLATALEELSVTSEELREESLLLAEANRDLAAARTRYRSLFDDAPDAYVVTDSAGTVVEANRAAERLLATPVQRLVGKPLLVFVPPELRMDFRQRLAEVDRGTSYAEDWDARLQARTGELRTVAISTSAERRAGQASGAVGDSHLLRWLIRDVTAAEAARALARDRDLADWRSQKADSLAILAGGVAHDFNNLLAVVIANAGLARAELAPEAPAQEALAQIEEAGQRAATLAQQMLAYAGGGQGVLRRLDVGLVVSDAVRLAHSIVNRDVDIDVDIAPDLEAVVGDATQLQQVVVNLLVNAAEASDRGSGPVRLSVRSRDAGSPSSMEHPGPGRVAGTSPRSVEIEVRDHGRGIAPEVRERILEPFFSTKANGRGLGLAAVSGIVAAHGGTLEVDSPPGGGAAFRVVLPSVPSAVPGSAVDDATEVAARQAEVDPGTRAGAIEPATTRDARRTILIVDDEPSVAMVARRALERMGADVVVATDGPEALTVFDANADAIEVVLLDITLPHLGGMRVAAELLARAPSLKIVLSSGWSSIDQHDLAALGPGVSFLPKPYTLAELAAALDATRRPVSGTS